MNRSFRDLSAEFSARALSFPLGKNPATTLLMRYEALKHKAETREEKAELAGALYKCGLALLATYLPPTKANETDSGNVGSAQLIFGALQAPESLPYLPEKAAEELADIALALLDRRESISELDFSPSSRFYTCRNMLDELVRIALKTADAIRAEAQSRDIDIGTSKIIRPLKPLVLKPREPPAT